MTKPLKTPVLKQFLPPIFFNQKEQWVRLKVMLNQIVQQLAPPILLDIAEAAAGFSQPRSSQQKSPDQKALAPTDSTPSVQALEVYWNPKMAQALETWGESTTWSELEYLMVNCRGKVLDIACGTGKTIEILSRYRNIEVYGCDISDFFIQKALERGIEPHRLKVCDATQTDYSDNFFDYAYSIGSLEHFTEDGILQFVQESHRITKYASFHMVPISRLAQNEGWIHKFQSYYNNSTDWWLTKFKTSYDTVIVLDSAWQDRVSLGKWFVCIKEPNMKEPNSQPTDV
jgi:ubiquinone/menaquinone biosynthesis C-methylase UbiE